MHTLTDANLEFMPNPEGRQPEIEEMTKKEYLSLYLRKQVNRGNYYFKSKYISADTHLSSKQVGQLMSKLNKEADGLEVEKWGSKNSTTWRVDCP